MAPIFITLAMTIALLAAGVWVGIALGLSGLVGLTQVLGLERALDIFGKIVWEQNTNFVLLAISGVFNPIDALPALLQPVAAVLPSTHAFDAVRQILDGQPLPWDDVIAALIGSTVALAAGIGYSTWMLRVFRRRGLVTRFS